MNPDVYKGIYGGCRDSLVQAHPKCDGLHCTDTTCSSADKYVKQLEEIFSYRQVP